MAGDEALPAPAAAPAPDGRAYTQPTPRLLYVHDDLTALVDGRLGADSPAAALTGELMAVLARRADAVRILTLSEQLDGVVAQGTHQPFDLAVGIGRAGEAVARALHARTGWFPRIRVVGLTREEDGDGGYRLVPTDSAAPGRAPPPYAIGGVAAPGRAPPAAASLRRAPCLR